MENLVGNGILNQHAFHLPAVASAACFSAHSTATVCVYVLMKLKRRSLVFRVTMLGNDIFRYWCLELPSALADFYVNFSQAGVI